MEPARRQSAGHAQRFFRFCVNRKWLTENPVSPDIKPPWAPTASGRLDQTGTGSYQRRSARSLSCRRGFDRRYTSRYTKIKRGISTISEIAVRPVDTPTPRTPQELAGIVQVFASSVQWRYLGGHNLGPVPEEDILGRMITCLTHIYEIEASRRQIKLDGLELKVEAR